MAFKKFRPNLSENAALYAALFVFSHSTTSINLTPSLTSMHWTHSFRILPYDRSTDPFKSESPTECDPVRPLSIYGILYFPKIVQYLLTISSSSCRYFYPSFYITFCNVFEKAAPAKDVTNSFSFPFIYCT